MKKILFVLIALVCAAGCVFAIRNAGTLQQAMAPAKQTPAAAVSPGTAEQDFSMGKIAVKQAPKNTPADAKELFAPDANRSVRVFAECIPDMFSRTTYLSDGTPVPPDPAKIGLKTAAFHFSLYDKDTGVSGQLCNTFMKQIRLPEQPGTYPVITDAILDGKLERMRVIVYYDPGHVSFYDVKLLEQGRRCGPVFEYALIDGPVDSSRAFSAGDSFYFVTPSVIKVSLEQGPRCHYALGYRYFDQEGVDPDKVFSEPEAVKKGYIGIENVDYEPLKTRTEFFAKWSNGLWSAGLSGVPLPKDAPRTLISDNEPAYDMDEWAGWTRMERG